MAEMRGTTPTVTTTAAGPGFDTFSLADVHYVHVETKVEGYARLANEHAERAMEYGLAGYAVTAQCCAQMADMCALFATILRTFDDLTEQF